MKKGQYYKIECIKNLDNLVETIDSVFIIL